CSYSYFFFTCCGHTRILHSFPTRRSSDLGYGRIGQQVSVPITGNRAKRIVHGALNIATGGLLLLITEVWDAVTHQFFLEMIRRQDRKSTRLNSSHLVISYAVFCLKKKIQHSLERHDSQYRSLEEPIHLPPHHLDHLLPAHDVADPGLLLDRLYVHLIEV